MDALNRLQINEAWEYLSIVHGISNVYKLHTAALYFEVEESESESENDNTSPIYRAYEKIIELDDEFLTA